MADPDQWTASPMPSLENLSPRPSAHDPSKRTFGGNLSDGSIGPSLLFRYATIDLYFSVSASAHQRFLQLWLFQDWTLCSFKRLCNLVVNGRVGPQSTYHPRSVAIHVHVWYVCIHDHNRACTPIHFECMHDPSASPGPETLLRPFIPWCGASLCLQRHVLRSLTNPSPNRHRITHSERSTGHVYVERARTNSTPT